MARDRASRKPAGDRVFARTLYQVRNSAPEPAARFLRLDR